MTARARQRRMRRMKEKQENANNNITTTSIIGVNKQQNKTAEESNTAKNTNSNNNIPSSKKSSTLSYDRHVDNKLTRGIKSSSRHERSLHSRRREERANADNPSPKKRVSDFDSLLPPTAQSTLSAQEVRDATNFTSVQFCLSSEGQVEMLSDVGTNDDNVEDDSRMEKQVFMNELWNTRRLMKEGSILNDNTSGTKNGEFLGE